MLLKYRLELLLIVLVGMLSYANHLMLTSIFLGLVFIELAMNIVIYKNLIGNPTKLAVLLREMKEYKEKKKTTREKLIKIEFWLVLIGIVTTALLTKSIIIIAISLFVVLLEVGKLLLFKKLQKESLQ
jgi:hypothetical protein